MFAWLFIFSLFLLLLFRGELVFVFFVCLLVYSQFAFLLSCLEVSRFPGGFPAVIHHRC